MLGAYYFQFANSISVIAAPDIAIITIKTVIQKYIEVNFEEMSLPFRFKTLAVK